MIATGPPSSVTTWARAFPAHPENIKGGIDWDVAYWAKNRDAVTEKFNAWVTA
jgi:putative spermidine/putrescine transport system substrate-binding protein